MVIMKLLLLHFLLVLLVVVKAKPRQKEREKPKPGLGGVVLTESGQLCHFPFLYARVVHNTCIRKGRLRPWCSLTRNFDKDKRWSFCVEGSKVTDYCENNPCESRGVCENTLKGYNCVCHEQYTGKNCKKEKCYADTLQQYFEPRDKWLRYRPPILEECTCGEKGTVCKVTTGAGCSENPCLHGGHCIQNRLGKVCGCTKEYMGPHCEIKKNENCFSGNGTTYRGTTKVTLTGTPCLNWQSDIIQQEVSTFIGHHAKKHGIGPHSYCRNPYGDIKPWCFVQKNDVLSWEHCNISQCQQSSGTIKPTRKPATPATPTKPSRPVQLQTSKTVTQTTIPTKPSHPVQLQTSKTVTQTSKSLLPTKAPNHQPTTAITTTVPRSTAASKDHAIPVDCGNRFLKSPAISPRIVGGMVALPASHPYMAAIYIGEQFCGGSLISSCWVVTAAHCLDDRPNTKSITVVLGQSLFNTTDHRTVKFPVKKYILHELYSEYTFQHDIALVELQDVNGVCAQFSQFVQPVCLPQSTMTAASAEHCEVVGWGHQYQGADHYAYYLQEAHVPILSNTQCQSPLSHGSRMMTGMICAGFMEGGVDACQGDSGGPLVCVVDGRVQLFGIVSWGSGCAEENKPGVYTDVPKYREWILTKIN